MNTALTTPHPEISADSSSPVDPFLVEALQNPRHRLTILRMELDVQNFLQNNEQQQFEFQHYPTSYLRLAAHRVANHYGLNTSVQDESRILVTKTTTETKFPSVRLSEIPPVTQQTEHMKKVSIKTRPLKGSGSYGGDFEKKRNPLKSVEERKEDYDKARARIFNGGTSPNSDSTLLEPRVAILRDVEKDRYDPDYDRSYVRYNRSLPVNQNFNLPPPLQPPYFEMGFTGYNHISSFGPPPPSYVMSPYGTPVQWPNAAMMHSHSYEQLRNASLQAQFYQQPLGFNYMQQNH